MGAACEAIDAKKSNMPAVSFTGQRPLPGDH
jgi:hypothetical protein